MKYCFLPAAEMDLKDAVDYYENCREGLGREFAFEVSFAIDRILQYPDGWECVTENSRRCLILRFPYELIYTLENNYILILAIANQHRHPNSWKNR